MRLTVSLAPTPDQRAKLLALAHEIDVLTDDELQAALDDMLDMEKPELTQVRLVAADDEGRTVVDECPAIFPGLPNIDIQLESPESQPQADRATANRTQDMYLHYWARESPAEVVRVLRKALEGGSLGPVCQLEEPRPPLPTEVRYTFKALQETAWERMHQVVIEVKPQSDEWRQLETAILHQDKGDLETSIEVLADCIVDAPCLRQRTAD